MKWNPLYKKLAFISGYQKVKTWRILRSLRKIFTEILINDKKLIIPNIGTFKLKIKKATRRKMPKQGFIKIPAKYFINYIPSIELKKAISKLDIKIGGNDND